MTLLRYPGGKSKLLPRIRPYLDPLLERADEFHDVFAGGASVALDVARRCPRMRIFLNDLDPDVSALWSLCVDGSDEEVARLFKLIDQELTIELFRKLQAEKSSNLVERAYRCIFINRTTRSGMLNAGPIGGKQQNGRYRIGERYRPNELKAAFAAARSSLRGRTTVSCVNALQYLKWDFPDGAVLYLDPPYVKAGVSLYPVWMSVSEHDALVEILKEKKNWVLSYDCCDEVRQRYSWASMAAVPTRYSINTSRATREEYIITPTVWAEAPSSAVVFSSSSSSESSGVQPPAEKDADSALGQHPAPAISLSTSTVNFSEQEYLTTKEAAAYLRRSVSWLLRQKDIPYLRGTPNTYRKSDVDDWFEQNKTQMP